MATSRSSFFAGVLFALAGFVSAPAPVAAQGAETVKLSVSVIHATKGETSMDPALEKIKGSLIKAFAGYTAFKQLSSEQLTLARGKKRTQKLPNAHDATYTYQGQEKAQYRLNLAVPQSKVDVDLRVGAKRVFYQAGLPFKDGILILAMSIEPA